MTAVNSERRSYRDRPRPSLASIPTPVSPVRDRGWNVSTIAARGVCTTLFLNGEVACLWCGPHPPGCPDSAQNREQPPIRSIASYVPISGQFQGGDRTASGMTLLPIRRENGFGTETGPCRSDRRAAQAAGPDAESVADPGEHLATTVRGNAAIGQSEPGRQGYKPSGDCGELGESLCLCLSLGSGRKGPPGTEGGSRVRIGSTLSPKAVHSAGASIS